MTLLNVWYHTLYLSQFVKQETVFSSFPLLQVGLESPAARLHSQLCELVRACIICRERIKEHSNELPASFDPGINFTKLEKLLREGMQVIIDRFDSARFMLPSDMGLETYYQQCEKDLSIIYSNIKSFMIEQEIKICDVVKTTSDSYLLKENARWANLLISFSSRLMARNEQCTDEDCKSFYQHRLQQYMVEEGNEVEKQQQKWLHRMGVNARLAMIGKQLESLLSDVSHSSWTNAVETGIKPVSFEIDECQIGHIMFNRRAIYNESPDWDYYMLRNLVKVSALVKERQSCEMSLASKEKVQEAKSDTIMETAMRACLDYIRPKSSMSNLALLLKAVVDHNVKPELTSTSQLDLYVDWLIEMGEISEDNRIGVKNSVKSKISKMRASLNQRTSSELTRYKSWLECPEKNVLMQVGSILENYGFPYIE